MHVTCGYNIANGSLILFISPTDQSRLSCFFFFLQNVQPNFLLLMVVFLLFSFVKFHFCHISSEVFLLLYFFLFTWPL